MPSPTATMRPTSLETSFASKSLSLSLMTSEISFVLMLTRPLLACRQPAAKLLQTGGDGGVDDAVAVLELQAAEDSRVGDHREMDLFADALRQLLLDPVSVF